MATKLFFRTTTTNGVTDYWDLLSTAGAGSSHQMTCTTTASGTEIPFRENTGTTVKYFITEYVASAFTLTSVDFSTFHFESNMSANAGPRARVFKRNLAGTETELGGGPFNDGVEFSTSVLRHDWTGNVTDTAFAVDDRIVIKMYATNVGTMAAGFQALFRIDGTEAGGEASFVNFAETISFSSSPSGPRTPKNRNEQYQQYLAQ